MVLKQDNNAEPFWLKSDRAPDGFLSANQFIQGMITPAEFGQALREEE